MMGGFGAMKKLSVALVTTSKALVPSSFFVITSKAPVTTSVALVSDSCSAACREFVTCSVEPVRPTPMFDLGVECELGSLKAKRTRNKNATRGSWPYC